jgi:hypothetical protein
LPLTAFLYALTCGGCLVWECGALNVVAVGFAPTLHWVDGAVRDWLDFRRGRSDSDESAAAAQESASDWNRGPNGAAAILAGF